MPFLPLQKNFLILPVFILAAGCFSGQQIVAEKAPALFREVALSAGRQSDVTLVRQGIPSYLMLIDGMMQGSPGNKELLLAGAQAYASYASVLEEDEKERIASLNGKAKKYALQALELTPPFQEALGKPIDVFLKRLAQAGKQEVPTLFWVGNIWGSWIASTESVEALADLPWAEALM